MARDKSPPKNTPQIVCHHSTCAEACSDFGASCFSHSQGQAILHKFNKCIFLESTRYLLSQAPHHKKHKMKFFYLPLPLLIAVASCARVSSATIADDFNGSDLDSSKWGAYYRDSSSSVTVANGSLSLTNRGGVFAKGSFDLNHLSIEGAFRFSGNNADVFWIAVGCSGQSFSPFYGGIADGMLVGFSSNTFSDHAGSNIWITHRSQATSIVHTLVPIDVGDYYDFKITGNSGMLNVYLNGSKTPSLQTAIIEPDGDQVYFFNREQIWNFVTDVDSLSVTSSAIPEPSIAIYSCLLPILCCLRRSRID